MDPLAQVVLTRELIDIDSTTGREGEVADALARHLTALGYRVVQQPLEGGRSNVLATRDAPVVVFSTHFDCVPPFFPSREERGRLYGRGACDAKGILVAQIAAAERLKQQGETRVGLLFVAGEERGSDGAKAANHLAMGSKYLINGEPTDNRLGVATRGVYRAKLKAKGRAAHSSLPELGESAIDKLVDALVEMRKVAWPADPEMGTTFYSVGLISGGVAPNVISPSAEAEVMFRTVSEYERLRTLMQARLSRFVTIEDVLVVPPVKLTTPPDFETASFPFTTDIPYLDQWGAPLLLGPGSITVAHTAEEHVGIAELHRAVDLYAHLAKSLIG